MSGGAGGRTGRVCNRQALAGFVGLARSAVEPQGRDVEVGGGCGAGGRRAGRSTRGFVGAAGAGTGSAEPARAAISATGAAGDRGGRGAVGRSDLHRGWRVCRGAVPGAVGRAGVRQTPLGGVLSGAQGGCARRLLQRLDVEALDGLVGRLAGRAAPPRDASAVAVDGKSLRGAVGPDGQRPHLLAALVHGQGTVIAQRRVVAKTNEIGAFVPLLDEVDLAGRVVTADSLHTQRAHARYLIEQREAAYLLVVNGNQASMFTGHRPDLRAGVSPHRTTPLTAATAASNISPPGSRPPRGLALPHARQVAILQRYTTDLTGGNPRTEVCYAVTSQPAAQAGPGTAGRALAGRGPPLGPGRDLRRGHQPYPHRLRPAGHGTLRNLAVGLLRQGGHTSIAPALRRIARNPPRALAFLGIP